VVLMIGQFQETRFRDRLDEEARAQNLGYLAYLLVPTRGVEGILVEVGQALSGPRNVEVAQGPLGRAQLLWPLNSPYTAQQAQALLAELAPGEEVQALSARLHSTICQSLTAAHLHLELGLMNQTDPPEEFTLARQLVHEAAVSVRELIDDLAGSPS
jgi:signal transduction histidine kinase